MISLLILTPSVRLAQTFPPPDGHGVRDGRAGEIFRGHMLPFCLALMVSGVHVGPCSSAQEQVSSFVSCLLSVCLPGRD